MYGYTLRLPGEYVNSTSTSSQLEPHSYATQLNTIIHKLQPPTTHKQKQCTTHIHSDLSSCPYVFVWHDGVRKLLQPPYNGAFKILQRSSKCFTLDVSGQKKFISLDHLKPAHIDIPHDTVPDSLPHRHHLKQHPPLLPYQPHLSLTLLGQADMYTGLKDTLTIDRVSTEKLNLFR